MELEQFFLDNINKILEYFDQDILTIYTRRTVDAFIGSYFLVEKFADTAQVRFVDWPPEGGMCLGFKCDGFYINENEVGIGGSSIRLEAPLPISYIIYKLTKSITNISKEDILKLYIGAYSWFVDNCVYKCNEPTDFVNEIETKTSFSIPFPDKPLGEALSLTTLPLLPGVLGRGLKEDRPLRSIDPRRLLDILDEALGLVYEYGFYPALADKGIRRVPVDADIATRSVEIEALLAGYAPDTQGISLYVESLAKIIDDIIRNYNSNIININNVFYIYKLMNYLPYFSKLKDILILRADVGRGFVASFIAPLKETQKLKDVAERVKDMQTINYETSIIAFVPKDRWPEVITSARSA